MRIFSIDRRWVITAGAAALLWTGAAGAQSSLGTQGYGYPPGQLSTRAYATGGAIAEVDPWSAVNPASIVMFGGRLLYFQIEPEYRTLSNAQGIARTTTARYPLVFGAMRVGENWTVSAGASTLLDRSSATTTITHEVIGGQPIDVTNNFLVEGAINDLRLATAWQPRTWLRVGLGMHGYTGRNLVTIDQTFSDTTSFVGFSQQRELSFSGGAVSLGAQLVSKMFIGAASFRAGGTMHVSALDTSLASANVPGRFGLSLAYVGFANSTIAIRTSHDGWSALDGLGSPSLRARDSWDTSLGADLAGPRFAGRPLMLRLGGRVRTLPFPAAGKDVTEKSITAGLGTLWAQGHLITDLALIRADRDAGLPDTEKAWTLSVGVTIRP